MLSQVTEGGEMMHPQFRIETLHENARELEHGLSRARLLATPPTTREVPDEAVSLRLCRVSDDPILERLAAFEGREVPNGRHLIAEVNGEIVASLPLLGGGVLADPFRSTEHLLPLMRLRAAQLYAPPRPRIDAAKAIAARMLHPAR